MLRRRVRKVLDWVAGLALILLGIIGGAIPFFPGWVCVVAGLAVLSSHSRWAHAIHVRMVQLGRTIRAKLTSPSARPSADDPGGDPPASR